MVLALNSLHLTVGFAVNSPPCFFPHRDHKLLKSVTSMNKIPQLYPELSHLKESITLLGSNAQS